MRFKKKLLMLFIQVNSCSITANRIDNVFIVIVNSFGYSFVEVFKAEYGFLNQKLHFGKKNRRNVQGVNEVISLYSM